MIEKQNGLVEFANIYCNGKFGMTSYLGIPVNEEHAYWFGLRFANAFSLLFESKVSYGRNSAVKDLYHLLSSMAQKNNISVFWTLFAVLN